MPVPTPVLLMARALGLGGTERQLTETARFLDRERFTPYVGCMIAEGMRAQEIEQAGVPLVTFPVRSFRDFSLLRGARDLISFIRANDIRLVHTFDVPMNLFGTLPARMAGTPVVLSSQRAYRDLTPHSSGRRLLGLTDRIVDGVVVNCEAMREHLRADEGVRDERIFVCYNGIDVNSYKPVRIPGPGRLAGSIVIGVVCALRPEKGLGTLVDAFGRIQREFPGVELAIVGSGSEEASLRRQVAALGIADCVHFEPATRDVARWLGCIDIFVLPSLSEALSNSLMEAMACGCCPVASRIGGNPELVSSDTGLLFEAGNADDLARQLRVLVENPNLRNQYAAASANLIASKFTHQASARRMGEIYEDNLRRKISDRSDTLTAR